MRSRRPVSNFAYIYLLILDGCYRLWSMQLQTPGTGSCRCLSLSAARNPPLGYAGRMTTASLVGRGAIVFTVSDRCFAGTQADRSGPVLADLLQGAGATLVGTRTVSDDLPGLITALRESVEQAALIITTGGTGLAPRDNTPEATLAVCERLVPGIAELIRQQGARDTPFAALGRGVCGVAGACLILNLPGNPAGASASLKSVLHLLPHALDLLAGKTRH